MTAALSGPDCPFCKSSNRLLEHLAHGWKFCNGCARRFILDDNGELVRGGWSDTNHSPSPVVKPNA